MPTKPQNSASRLPIREWWHHHPWVTSPKAPDGSWSQISTQSPKHLRSLTATSTAAALLILCLERTDAFNHHPSSRFGLPHTGWDHNTPPLLMKSPEPNAPGGFRKHHPKVNLLRFFSNDLGNTRISSKQTQQHKGLQKMLSRKDSYFGWDKQSNAFTVALSFWAILLFLKAS